MDNMDNRRQCPEALEHYPHTVERRWRGHALGDTAGGSFALESTTGGGNTASGFAALFHNSTGEINTAVRRLGTSHVGKPLHQILEEWASAYERLMMRIIAFMSPVVLPVLTYAVVRIGVQIAARMHWALEFATAVGFVVLAEYLRRLLRREFFEKFPAPIVITMFGISVAAVISAFAATSYSLMHQQIAIDEIRADYSIGTFADYYAWTFFDMLPGLDV
jgi:hypothetical protein